MQSCHVCQIQIACKRGGVHIRTFSCLEIHEIEGPLSANNGRSRFRFLDLAEISPDPRQTHRVPLCAIINAAGGGSPRQLLEAAGGVILPPGILGAVLLRYHLHAGGLESGSWEGTGDQRGVVKGADFCRAGAG